MNLKYRQICLILMLWTITHFIYATTLSAHTEPASVSPGEPFNLILELDENAPSGLPDFGVLGHDFYVHGTAHSASYVFTNGQSKASTRWTVTLVAKHAGNITIPAIQVGQARSQPITLNVGRNNRQRPSTSPQTPDRALFIKTNISDTKTLLNQQILYTVKIFHYSSILDAAYQPPSLGDALIVPLGNNRQYQVIEQGRPYLVEEQKYAFFPQKTGAQVLFPPKFQALIYDDIPRRAEAHGSSASIHVKPIPEHFTPNTWLPAKKLSLHETYDQSNTRLDEGSTLTRTITVKATGLPAELLPPFEATTSNHFKSYPERPTFNNTIEGDNVVGIATIKVNYLLNHPGTITIPEQYIIWFNTDTMQKMEAKLPAKTLHIIPDINHSSSSSTADSTAFIKPAKQEKSLKKQAYSLSSAIVFHAILLVVFLSVSLIAFIVKRKYAHSIQKNRTKNQLLKQLKKACHANHPEAARDALLLWAQHAWPNVRILNLDDINQHAANTALYDALRTISEALYHPEKTRTWQGKVLWMAITKSLKERHKKRPKPPPNTLPPINPQH